MNKRSGDCLEVRVSIVVASYNCLEDIRQTVSLKSRLSAMPIQWVFVDGASVDGTREVISASLNENDVLISEPDNGIYDAWNKGIKAATSPWVIFVGAGDMVNQAWLQFVSTFSRDEKILYGDLEIAGDRKARPKCIRRFSSWEKVIVGMEKRMRMPIVGTAFSSNIFKQYSFDSQFKVIGDWDFMLRARKSFRGLYVGGVVQARMFIGGVSNSKRGLSLKRAEYKMLVKKHGVNIDLSYIVKLNSKIIVSRFGSFYSKLQKVRWSHFIFL